MVRFNRKNFTVYDLDTLDSIYSRIAGELKTLPKYLYFPNGIPTDTDAFKDIVVKDLLKKIRTHASKSIDFANLLEDLGPKLPSGIDIQQDILYPWLAFNTHVSKNGISYVEQFGDSLNQYFPNEKEFKNFWKKERAQIKNNLESRIEIDIETSKSTEKMYEEFQDIENIYVSTDFQTEGVALDMVLNIKDISLMEMFNLLELNKHVPLATINQYYKILKNFIPNEDWVFTEEDVLVLKVCERLIVNSADFKGYTDMKIAMVDEQIHAKVKLKITKKNVNQKIFIDRTLKVFNMGDKIAIGSIDETEVSGIFYYPQSYFDSYVFSDLVMNDPIFSHLISIDESEKATKRRSEHSQPWIYIHFDHPSIGHVTASITQQFTIRGDEVLKTHDLQLFPIGKEYIRVKVTKAKDINSVNKFIEMLGKLLTLYSEKYNEIVEIYRQYIPNFGDVEQGEVEDVDMTQLKNIAPEVFGKNYSSTCTQERQPTIIDSDMVKQYESKGMQVMKYPRDVSNTGERYESDGVDQNYYVCENPDYQFPGLQNNKKMENFKTHPVVPCCYSTNQMTKPRYRSYFGEKVSETRNKKQQDFIKTDKILGDDKFGVLPSNLLRLFNSLDPDPKYDYVRLGVHRNLSSFLNAVMVGMHESTNILTVIKESSRVKRLNKERKIISSENLAPVCRQSAYDMDISTVRKMISNPEEYLDPKIYTQLLEKYLNCNIFVFTRDQMIIPRHIQGYYKYKNKNPCVFIYEHWGSKSNNAQYPQCELIVRWNTTSTKDSQYMFSYDQEISKSINKLFRLMKKSNSLNKPIKELVFNLGSATLVSQKIDSYGKCRQINIEYKEKPMTLLTFPIAPLAIPENNEQSIHKVSISVALKFISSVKGKLLSQNEHKGIVTELLATIGNVNISIPVKDSEILEAIPITNQIGYPATTHSVFQLYNYNKKMARYMIEYTYWLFSRFLLKKNISVITDKLLSDFADSQIVVIPKFEYSYVNKKFSRNGGLMKDKKLVVTSEEMLKRLMYTLRLYSLRNAKSLINYHTRRVIQYYYKDITDFDNKPGQVILHGEESIEKWIQENRKSYVLHDSVTIGSRVPYFFQNKLVENIIFLAQNTTSLPQALDIGSTWIRDGYNKSVYAKNGTYVYTLYNYKGPNDIQIHSGDGKGVKILAYLVADTPFYTVLMDL